MSECCKPRPPAAYFALGKNELPGEFAHNGQTYRMQSLFKHDFWAATALYERVGGGGGAEDGELAVLKVQRTHHFLGFPMRWMGRILANHEVAVYERLQGIQGIPEFLGRFGETGLLHAFVPGHDLYANGEVGAAFFDDLSRLFEQIHERKVAYVDANKRENILHGEDGRPWLIDFQISCIYPNPFFGILSMNPLGRYITRRCIRADWYHFYKHKTRMVPAACTPEEFEKAKCPGVWHRVHRFFARPVICARRRLLGRYDLAKTR